ncbi:hypothetical protein [Extensimonas vulgaris]|uniref:DNA polymerase n=1 Tax=Extensimonas vulgaris TaxID=1031594 RepID=A0A369AL33_9BURK|nr:hypothetical protein [Extensimonas vulgaris]RCX10070.1 DNA polymerase [Extensimonas vulgaris]TWI36533.1 DNA polymerase [Extensimonas vulgaris]TXD17224.1 hypothetical protein FUT63_00265 [Extensimonas vulgaris]
MSLHLDARQRAMLQEMGIALWLPQPAARPPQPAQTPRPARPVLAGAPQPNAAADAALAAAEADVGIQPEGATAPHTPAPPQTADAIPTAAPAATRPASPRSQAVSPITPVTSRTGAAADKLPAALYVHALQALYPQADAQQTPPELGTGWLIVTETLPPTNPHAAAARKLLDNMLRALRLHLHPRVFLLALERPAPHAGAAPASAAAGADLSPALPGNGAPVTTSVPSLVASADIPATLGAAVAELQPSMVLLLGLLPARAALGRTDPLGALRAGAHQIGPAPAVVSYAPDFLLRSQASKAAAWADLCHALALVRRRCT